MKRYTGKIRGKRRRQKKINAKRAKNNVSRKRKNINSIKGGKEKKIIFRPKHGTGTR
jgi:hypothetical protein